MKKITLLFLLLATVCFNQAIAQNTTVYSWVDGKGARHYSDVSSVPMSQVKSTKAIDVKKPSTEIEVASKGVPPSEQNSQESIEDKKACDIAKKNQSLLSDSNRNVLNDDGKSLMSASDRISKLQKANAQVEAFCNVLGGGN